MDFSGAEAVALRRLVQGVSPSSAKVYGTQVKRFKRWCHSVNGIQWPPHAIATEHYVMSLIADGASPSAARNAGQLAARFLRYLAEEAPSSSSHVEPRTPVSPASSLPSARGRAPSAAAPTAMSPGDLILASLGLSVQPAADPAATPHGHSPALALECSVLVDGLRRAIADMDRALAATRGWAA